MGHAGRAFFARAQPGIATRPARRRRLEPSIRLRSSVTMSQSASPSYTPPGQGGDSWSAQPHSITRVRADSARPTVDVLAVEEPLEIRVITAGRERQVTVTMRTPGADTELAVGFLLSEGVIATTDEVRAVRPCANQPNLLRIELIDECAERVDRIARNFVATSSCGLCGKTSLEAVSVS